MCRFGEWIEVFRPGELAGHCEQYPVGIKGRFRHLPKFRKVGDGACGGELKAVFAGC